VILIETIDGPPVDAALLTEATAADGDGVLPSAGLTDKAGAGEPAAGVEGDPQAESHRAAVANIVAAAVRRLVRFREVLDMKSPRMVWM